MKSFHDTVVVITGAGSGMGRAYAVEAARRGATLALNDYDEGALTETTRLLPTTTRVLTRAFDVSDRDAMYGFADEVQQTLGTAGVVINNAGVEGYAKPAWALDDDEIRRIMDINFWGVAHGTRAFLPRMLEADAGTIINVSSLFGLVGSPNQADYCAAKFAVRGFSEALAAELTPTRVRVQLVHPGGVATNIARSDRGKGFEAKYLTTRPEDVANVVLDAVGGRKGRIVYGHRAPSTYLGVRTLPQRVMARLVWRDMSKIIDRSHYPAAQQSERVD